MCEILLENLKNVKRGFLIKLIVFPHLNSRCRVDITDFQSQLDVNYKFILAYQQILMQSLQTKKKAENVTLHLLHKFSLIGDQCVLQSDNAKDT